MKPFEIKNIHSLILLLSILSLSLYASISPDSELFRLVRGFCGLDKIGHFLFLMLLGLALNASMLIREKRGALSLPTLSLALLFTVDELIQLLIESRTFDLGDLFANLLGLIVGAFCSRYLPLWLHCNNKG
jgi:glycopeptide antibiotics resistance protein